jgi:ABC-type transporter MlaC component
MARAAELLRTSCPTDLPSSPIARLELMERQVDLMLQALEALRPALEKFDRSLTDEQRVRFAQRYARSASRGEPVAACKQQASGVTGWPISRIEQVVQPTEAQRNALIDLWAVSAKAANALNADCSREPPATPLARLQMVEKRLDATRQAVRTVRTALADFYKSLNDEQRARFDELSAPVARGHG